VTQHCTEREVYSNDTQQYSYTVYHRDNSNIRRRHFSITSQPQIAQAGKPLPMALGMAIREWPADAGHYEPLSTRIELKAAYPDSWPQFQIQGQAMRSIVIRWNGNGATPINMPDIWLSDGTSHYLVWERNNEFTRGIPEIVFASFHSPAARRALEPSGFIPMSEATRLDLATIVLKARKIYSAPDVLQKVELSNELFAFAVGAALHPPTATR